MRISATNATAAWLSLIAFVATGCQAPIIPNPNDPADVGVVSAPVLKRNLAAAAQFLNERRLRREITDAQAGQKLAETAQKLIGHVDLRRISPSSAWEYGDVFRAARRWDLALKAYTVAVEHASNEDRRVNDNLRLAAVLAELNRVDEALEKARSVFDAAPEDRAPILPAILYELIPAARGKGKDVELAGLLERAIEMHLTTTVDESGNAGKRFIIAMAHHVSKAWDTVADLYRDAGREDLAQAAAKRSVDSLKRASDRGFRRADPRPQ